jgi:hypothetical protein
MTKYNPLRGTFPPNLLKLARRLLKEAARLFPDDERQQEIWYYQQFDQQLKNTPQNVKIQRTLIAVRINEAIQDAYEDFPHDEEKTITRFIELMDWDDEPETRELAEKALDMFLTNPIWAEDKEIRS